MYRHLLSCTEDRFSGTTVVRIAPESLSKQKINKGALFIYLDIICRQLHEMSDISDIDRERLGKK